jgi:hypothetical protein
MNNLTQSTAENITENETLTEKGAFADILHWSMNRPAWQRDALRRLISSGELSNSDIDELTTICLDPNAPSEPLASAHIKSEGISGEAISLIRIEHPTGINALPKDQTLEFAKHGLTVIYGDNGSGKSGYVRILKHACRTRDGQLKILRDIEDTEGTPQSAKIVLAYGATDDEFD